MRVEAEVDIADAIDLDRALAHGAATRRPPRLDRSPSTRGGPRRWVTWPGPRPRSTSPEAGADREHLPAAREVVLHAHFDASFSGEPTVFGPTGRLEEGQRLVLLDQVKAWCADSRTKVTIKPVIDLNTDLTTPAYEIPDRIREQVVLRDRTCVFPWCTRPARGCDIDHVIRVRPRRRSRGSTPARAYADATTSPPCAGSTIA